MDKPLVIISGGSGYVGKALADAFAAQNWEVVSLSRTGTDGMRCDVTDRSSANAAIEEIVKKFGKIRACIHAAASPLERVSILETSEASVIETLNTAYLGALHLAHAAIPHMEATGAFIGITSGAIEPGETVGAMGSYLPAKYALRGFLRALSVDPAARVIRVYAVSPDFLPGGLNDDLPRIVKEVFSKDSNTTETSVLELGKMIVTLASRPSSVPSGSSIQFPSGDVSPL